MKISALLLAAGNGSRFGSKIPKQFQSLGDKKIYRHALDIMISSNLFDEIVIVTKEPFLRYLDPHLSCKIAFGGDTRQESVYLGLQSIKADAVVICDGVRPFLTPDLLTNHVKKLHAGDIAINTCIPCTDTINIHKNGVIQQIPDRANFFQGQTPQSFSFKPLLKAHANTTKKYTDDCSLMLDSGFNISFVEGCKTNLKITTMHDFEVASLIVTKN